MFPIGHICNMMRQHLSHSVRPPIIYGVLRQHVHEVLIILKRDTPRTHESLSRESGSNEARHKDALLSVCSIEEQCTKVRFLWAERERVKLAEIHCWMLAQYGVYTMYQRQEYEWEERFKAGRTRVTDESRPGRPSTWRL